MNITERILNDPNHPRSDVRKTSQGGDYPYGVVLRMDGWGQVFYEGFHAGRGVYTGAWRRDRAQAITDIKRECA